MRGARRVLVSRGPPVSQAFQIHKNSIIVKKSLNLPLESGPAHLVIAPSILRPVFERSQDE